MFKRDWKLVAGLAAALAICVFFGYRLSHRSTTHAVETDSTTFMPVPVMIAAPDTMVQDTAITIVEMDTVVTSE